MAIPYFDARTSRDEARVLQEEVHANRILTDALLLNETETELCQKKPQVMKRADAEKKLEEVMVLAEVEEERAA